jgi:hypothetical protein
MLILTLYYCVLLVLLVVIPPKLLWFETKQRMAEAQKRIDGIQNLRDCHEAQEALKAVKFKGVYLLVVLPLAANLVIVAWLINAWRLLH